MYLHVYEKHNHDFQWRLTNTRSCTSILTDGWTGGTYCMQNLVFHVCRYTHTYISQTIDYKSSHFTSLLECSIPGWNCGCERHTLIDNIEGSCMWDISPLGWVSATWKNTTRSTHSYMYQLLLGFAEASRTSAFQAVAVIIVMG